MNLETMSATDLSKLDIKGIDVSEPFGTLLGEPEKNAVYFIWGAKGAGKSTFSLALADALANHGRVEYIPAEEQFGKTLVDRVKRLDATHSNLHFTKFSSVEALKGYLEDSSVDFVVLDSITVIDGDDRQTVKFAQWCRNAGIGFLMVAHATKDGQYKGNTSIAHECDIEIQVTLDGEAITEKNRYRTLTSIQVPFTAEDREILRKNPVNVPFSITLKELYETHNFRSYKRLNSMFGSKMPCYAKKHSGESETAHFSLRYTPDYSNKKYLLELLLDGHLEHQICKKGANGSFKACLKELVGEYGDLEIVIYRQDHAKKVLGARRYAKQERKYAKLSDMEKQAETATPKEKSETRTRKKKKSSSTPKTAQKPGKQKKKPKKWLVFDDANGAAQVQRVDTGGEPEEAENKKFYRLKMNAVNEMNRRRKKTGGNGAPAKPKPAQKQTEEAEIDVAAVRESQSKLDNFLAKMLQ